MFDVGVRVEIVEPLFDLPIGTKGVIDEDYGTGFMVKWDERPYRDGFDKWTELKYLKAING